MVPSLVLGTWPHCLLLKSVTRDVCVLHWSVVNRDLSFNQITSIFNGAFAGLGNLATLFVTWSCDAWWMCVWLKCREQVPVFQPNHIDIERRLHRTWQLDHTVCYLSLWRVMNLCIIRVSWTGTCLTTRSHRFPMMPSLVLATWPHCLLLEVVTRDGCVLD